ncbi:MAG: tryptophan--tRNA ligase [Candidatus Pacebacteria bacterium]|nr:tryptophan--tRNA ligase [Candidatus Paceibacterota bacterium]
MHKTKKRLLSGIKPTGDLHIGNYFGAMMQFLEFQKNYESFIFIADYHALNQVKDPKKIKKDSLEIVKAYLAAGLDPKKVHLFKQSDVPQVTELCWIFNCILPMALLKRAHAYKDAVAKGKSVNMGLFDYPVLMAADILIYNSDIVPVGKDQKQHVEMAQETAKRFNNIYGKTFKIPEIMVKQDVAVIKGLDGRKMSKSYNNVIGLFDSEEETKEKIMKIVTDSKRPEEPKNPENCNVFYFHKLFSPKSELEKIRKRYKEGGISYQESKEILAKNINKFLAKIRDKKKKLDKNENYIKKVLEEGKTAALREAQKTLNKAKKKVGVI